MVNVRVLCDDRFDGDLTYTIEGEKMGDRDMSGWCLQGLKESECKGCFACIWKEAQNEVMA